MTDPKTGRRWRVTATSYYGTPHPSKATNRRERAEYRMEGGPNTALGDRVSKGDIAVPSNIPLGSVFYVPGYGWGIAKDHGTAIRGNRIDLATGGVIGDKVNPEARAAAKAWGRKNQTVYVFPPGYQIPKDHSPPQAFLNDLRNAKSNTVAKADTSAPKLTPAKSQKPVKKVAVVAPKLPKSNVQTADEKAWYGLIDSHNKEFFAQPGKNESTFFKGEDIAADAYVTKAKKAFEDAHRTADGWEAGREALAKIREAATYWAYKKRLSPANAKWVSDTLDHYTARLTPPAEWKTQPNNSPIGKTGTQTSDIKLPQANPVSTLAAPNVHNSNMSLPSKKEISLSDLGNQLAVNTPNLSDRTLRYRSALAEDTRPNIGQAEDSGSKSLAQTVKSGIPTQKPVSVQSPQSPLTQVVQSERPTPKEPVSAQPQPSALTQYIKQINETDKIKSDSVKGAKQYAAAAKSYNNVRRSIDSSALSNEQKAKLRQIQGNYPYQG